MEEVELAEPRAGELLVRLKACGICGTDEATRQGHTPLQLPAVLGHEGAGIVEAVGPGVRTFEPGDHVCLTFSSCGTCEFCLQGKPYRCELSGYLNFEGRYLDDCYRLSQNGQDLPAFFGQSSFATHVVVSERGAVKIQKDIPFAVAAPMGCGVQTGAGTVCNVFAPRFGESLAVFGIGTVSMSAIMMAKVVGCEPIIAVGGTPHTLELAQELGATHTLNWREIGAENLAEAIRSLTNKGAHYSIETSSATPLMKAAIACLRFDGVVAVMAPGEPFEVNLFTDFIDATRKLVGVMEGAALPQLLIPRLLDFYAAGRFPVDKLIKTYAFTDINQAFEDSKSGKVLKAVLVME